jgi:prepilin-type N-terminal cleavage/methylation domain-containing protein
MRHSTRHARATNDRGFTLMELLVVLGLFSTVVVASSDIFLLANRSQRKLFGLERTQADARFTMEAITREVRTGLIDYAYYAGRGTAMGTPDGELALIDSTNTKVKFQVSDTSNEANCADASSKPCLLVSVGGGTPTAVTPKGVQVNNAKFYISPTTDPNVLDPNTGAYAANVQPHVTVVLILRSTRERSTEQSVVYLQTTATNRKYKR